MLPSGLLIQRSAGWELVHFFLNARDTKPSVDGLPSRASVFFFESCDLEGRGGVAHSKNRVAPSQHTTSDYILFLIRRISEGL